MWLHSTRGERSLVQNIAIQKSWPACLKKVLIDKQSIIDQVTVYAEKESGEVLDHVDNVHWVYGRKISEQKIAKNIEKSGRKIPIVEKCMAFFLYGIWCKK